MPNFKFVDFSCNLLQFCNLTQIKEACLVIYPTQNNANLAQMYSQNSWSFENILFLALEDFADMVLPCNHSILEDDKRVVALYLLMTDEEKTFFKVTDFFDFIKLANKIFTLFDELAVELIDFSSVFQLLEDANLIPFTWQKDYYEKILQLLARYQEWLAENFIEDKIFLKKEENINLEYFADYSHVFVVNQFYYTALERAFIEQMEKSGKDVTLVYQLPEEFVDKTTFNAQPFKYEDLRKLNKQEPELELITDRNRFTMMNSLCRLITDKEITQVIDRDFYKTPYAKLLSRNFFNVKYDKPIINSELYHFLDIIKLLLESLEFFNKQYFLPIHILIRAFHNSGFINYFQIPNSSILLEELYSLRDKGLLYCDIKGSIGKEVISESLKRAIEKILSLIKAITEINSISSLIALFDTENGIILDRLTSSEDLQYSNIKELVYTELANLQSFTHHKLIDKWSRLSAKAEYLIIYKLFMDGLKSKTIKYTQKDSPSSLRVNSLLDSRNNRYDSIVFLNMLEGVLPTARTSQFLFNERQREILTLKTYEDIRLREKYYFQRLVLSAKHCYFLGFENLEQDTSLSSFLEELPLIKPDRDLRQADRGYGQLFSKSKIENRESLTLSDDFWSVKLSPFELSRNSSTMKLSYTRLKSLIDNPLYYLIHDWAKVSEREILSDPSLDYRFVGIFAQNYINHIIARIKETFINHQVFYKFQFMDRKRLSEIYDSFLLTYQDKDYYIPHNYSYTFLEKILKIALVEGMSSFFYNIMHSKLKLSEKKLDLIPEEGYSPNKKQKYKSFISESENNYKLGIAVTGDADLRVENQEDDSKVVIDFKTGRSSLDQLALYQYIYYWDDIEAGKEVKAGIFQIINQEWKAPKDDANKTILKLKNKIIEVLNEVADTGFTLPKNKTEANKYEKITRSDLALRR